MSACVIAKVYASHVNETVLSLKEKRLLTDLVLEIMPKSQKDIYTGSNKTKGILTGISP